MFWRSSHRRHSEFWEGVRDQAGVATGIAAWGLMTGVAMVKAGLSAFEAVAMTLLVYAGSAQLTAVPLMASGAPLWVILAAAFCVNLRFVVFSAHLRPYVMHMPLRERLATGYVTGDLSYVFFARRYPHPGQTPQARECQQAYLAGNCAVNYLAWMSASLIGIALANVIPPEWGLGFAGILALLGVGCSLATSRLRVVSAGVAGAAAIAAWALPLKLNIVVAIAAAVAICLVIESYGPRWLRGQPVPPHA
ncbi:AzlC family ABC transporter permease [Tepidicella xavieri]|jgi:predicted branched-subunit amino acid permease|uniref:Putative branched-subunit amino acid permease n=1 Tax=Tepidicella xavieri TaxID=360241 RepID=A0A4R6UCA5_9BURK|nr:AzlC family ABC transporter permease [Tepidicella xavieri]TDQ44308.1 putative branched-subunit amino acid permease [Tepidicella xavieri]